MAASAPYQALTSRPQALQLLAAASVPPEGAELVLMAEYLTNEELCAQRNQTIITSAPNMTTRLGKACDLYALDHNQLPGTFRFHFVARRISNLEAVLGKNNHAVRAMRARHSSDTKDDWIPEGLSLDQLSLYRGINGKATCDALYGRMWEYMESHPGFKIRDVKVAFGYKTAGSTWNFVNCVRVMGPGISKIMAVSQPTALAIPRAAPRAAVRRREQTAPPASLPLVASSSFRLAHSPPSRESALASNHPLGALSTTIPRNASSRQPFPDRPNLVDMAYGHELGFDVASWFPPMDGPVTYVTSIAALYIGLVNGRNVKIIDNRTASEIEANRQRIGPTMYR